MKMRAILAAVLMLAALRVEAASIAQVNPSQLQIPATGADFNNLINAINAILSPLTGPNVPNAVNLIGFTPAVTGSPAIIGLQPGGDANASIQILPDPGGNLILFSGDAAQTGYLQLANTVSFVAAPSLAVCPGTIAGKPPLGLSGTVKGFMMWKDWLGVLHGAPSC